MSTVQGGQGNIVTNGLVLNLDAANPRSYPQPYNGTTWTDLSPYRNDMILVNAPTFNPAGFITFDNTDDFGYIDVTSTSGLIGGNVTMQLWVRNTSGNFIMQGKYGSYFGYGFYSNGLLKNSSGATGPSIAAYQGSSTWSNWAAIWDVANLQTVLYINGNLISTSGNSSFSTNTGGRLVFGGAFNSNNTLNKEGSFTLGYYAQYNRALSASEVLQNFNATRARFGV